jgi:hypothetical protein
MHIDQFTRAQEINQLLKPLYEVRKKLTEANQLCFGTSNRQKDAMLGNDIDFNAVTFTFKDTENSVFETAKLIFLADVNKKIKELETQFENL